VDPDWLQIFETSGSTGAPFYVTSHGLYLQALNDAFVSDYWGETEIGAACPAEWEGASFAGLRTADGKTLSGELSGGKWNVETA
jgi:acyl-coenzyme A synthetase/AMP-(fatty) acid ligase